MPQVRANGIHLEYETFGDPSHPALLLIMGLGAQMILWPDDFCRTLAGAGYYVIRFDNRDVGLSAKIEHAGRPRLVRAAIRSMFRISSDAPYTLDDMAKDALGLLDALGIRQAHVAGVSMGGMIGQIMAAWFPERVLSLTLIMTTSGNPRLRGPSLKLRLRLVKRPRLTEREEIIRYSMETWRLIGSPEYPSEETTLRQKVERSFDRSHYPRGLARQTLAIIVSGSRLQLLKRITAPTLIVHGEDDPLVPVEAAYELHKHIPGARLEIIPGMGHDLPAELLAKIAGMIVNHAGNVKRQAAA